MEKIDLEKKVASHYSRGDVTERILKALELQGAAPGSVGIEALFPVDQLHHGGLGLTEKMVEAAQIMPGMKILDAGSGLGGAARYIVDRFACDVDAIDLSETFVRTAKELDALVGLTDKIAHRTGSVTAIPFENVSFDAVWSQNVTMNVADKRTMFAEAMRVLRPGGVYVLTHVGSARKNPIEYPMPWAMTAETSFVTPPGELLQLLADEGFQNIVDHSGQSPIVPSTQPAGGQPDDSCAMGEDMPLRRANASRAVADGRLVPMLVTAHRSDP